MKFIISPIRLNGFADGQGSGQLIFSREIAHSDLPTAIDFSSDLQQISSSDFTLQPSAKDTFIMGLASCWIFKA